jgi:FkbM family methyltransferase
MKKFIRSILQQLGYDIVKYKPPFVRGRMDRDSFLTEHKWVQLYQFKTIIDIGANEGQFADKMRLLFPQAMIYAFEPLPQVYDRLKANFNQDNAFEAINVGLGENQGILEFWENEYSPSSSFLRLTDTLKENLEEASIEKKVEVKIDTLDHVFADRTIQFPLLIKMDVQGFEDKVIKGAGQTIRKADMIICEISFTELYKGQPLFEDIFELLGEQGFYFAGQMDQISSPETQKPLQADGIFLKKA